MAANANEGRRIQLTSTYKGAVIVTTPHTLAVKDAAKGMAMFQKVNVDILGLVQNMSLYTCPHCGGESHVFGATDAVKKLCADYEADFLGDIPLDPRISEAGDSGKPTVAVEPSSQRSAVFIDIARRIARRIGLASSP
jgi:ATP-binding protein involved in chromosome partitioning